VSPLNVQYRLPDDDIDDVNSRKVFRVLIKRPRADNPSVYDLIIM